MTDTTEADDLVKRLRSSMWGQPLPSEAADRIEELEAKLALMERKCATLYEGWRISDHSRIDAEAKLAKAVDALDEAVYLLRPDEKDMMRQAGVYRIVTTLAELKGQNDE